MLVKRKSDAKNRTKEKQRSLKTKLKPGFQFLSFTCVRRPVCVCERESVCENSKREIEIYDSTTTTMVRQQKSSVSLLIASTKLIFIEQKQADDVFFINNLKRKFQIMIKMMMQMKTCYVIFLFILKLFF